MQAGLALTEVVVADIGGTHARFAIAAVEPQRVVSLSNISTLKTAEHASLQTAWNAFAGRLGRTLPRALSIAVASPVGGEVIKLTNNPWVIRPAQLNAELGIDAHVLINDFGAIGHAVALSRVDMFTHVCGPDEPLPTDGAITVIGPGTGLGVALVLRRHGEYQVVETEGGHMDYAPLDAIEDRLVAWLRQSLTRVSVERIVAGPGIAAIYHNLAAIEGRVVPHRDDREIWSLALGGGDDLAAAALDRFCLALGAVAGDLALAHGAGAVVIAGGLGQRLGARLAGSGFAERFVAKGRFQAMMAQVPVKLITQPEPGLYGAAAAFAQRLTA